MEKTADIVIIGGGIIGIAIAYNLCKRGVDVIVLERGEIGGQASSAAAGLLAPLGPLSGPGPYADLLLSSFAMFPSLVSELEEASGIQIGYEQIGALRTIRNPKRIAHLKKRMQEWECFGLATHWLSGDEARTLEPQLSPDVCAAIYAPEESQISAPLLVKAFSKAATRSGARLYSHTEAVGIQHNHNIITGIHTSQGETISCNHLILTTGAWSAHYGQWLNIELPMRPLKGQILVLQGPQPPLKHIIFGDSAYLAPRGDSTLIGTTKEDAGFDTRVTCEGIEALRNIARRFVPTLQQSDGETAWAGLRPSTPDRQPILGSAPPWENVTLAVGHNSVGIILSPITGQAIAEVVITSHIPEIIRSFSLARLQLDSRKNAE